MVATTLVRLLTLLPPFITVNGNHNRSGWGYGPIRYQSRLLPRVGTNPGKAQLDFYIFVCGAIEKEEKEEEEPTGRERSKRGRGKDGFS